MEQLTAKGIVDQILNDSIMTEEKAIELIKSYAKQAIDIYDDNVEIGSGIGAGGKEFRYINSNSVLKVKGMLP